MASRYPAARWHPLGAQTETRMTGHDVLCYHTMVGYLASTDRYFRITNGTAYRGTESHYGVGGPWGPDLGGGLDGAVWQWQDRAYGADANLDGKRTVLSVETADNAPDRPEDIAPWSDRQLEALIRIGVWECSPAAHAACPPSWTCHGRGIPAVLIPDTRPGRRGIGYHRQGCDPYRVDGGVHWSSSYGKVCPGARRISQLEREVIPEIRRRLAGAPTKEDDDMPTPDELWQHPITNPDSGSKMSAADRLLDVQADVDEVKAALGRVEATLAKLAPAAPATARPVTR